MINVSALMKLGCRSPVRIGIGLPEETLKETSRRLEGLGCRFDLVSINEPGALVSALSEGKVQAAVRGTLSSAKVLAELKKRFSIDEVMRTAVLEDANRKQFLLTPVGIDEGRDLEGRIRLVEESIRYFTPIGWTLSIGVLSRGRLEDKHRGEDIRSSIEEGERLVEALKADGREAKHHAILIEEAVRESDLVVAPDGVTGNLIFRAMHFVGGGKAYGAPVVNIEKVFVDTSRSKADFSDAARLAAGLAEARSACIHQA